MNTKKITALALAALMAAGSTSTVFAAVDSSNKDKVLEFVDSTGKTYYEENDDGLLVVDKDGVAPGESVYFLLKDGNGVLNIEDKDRDRIKVYADWKMGKDYIKDIEVTYDKGNSIVTGYTYTVTAGSGYFKANPVITLKDDTKYENKDLSTFKDKIDLSAALAADYIKVEDGYIYGGKYYANDEKGLEALLTAFNWVKKSKSDQVQTTADTDKNGLGTITYGTGTGTPLTDTTWVDNATLNNATKFVDVAKIEKISDLFAITNDAESLDPNTVFSGVTAVGDDTYVAGTKLPATGDSITKKSKQEAETAIKDTITAIEDAKTVANQDKSSFTYWVKIDTKESFTTKEQDIAGTLYLGTSKNSAEKAKNEISIGLPLSNRIDDNNGSYVIKDGDTIYPDANGAVKFEDDAEEVTIYFGSNEDAWFTFNAAGQSALNLAYNTKFNKEIADLFPKANIDFISWIAEPAANRTGDLYITAEEDTFLYQVTEDGKGIKEVKGADYNEDEGAWHIRTRKLGSYVISDMELDTTAKVEDKDEASSNSSTSSKPNGDKHNPDTGR